MSKSLSAQLLDATSEAEALSVIRQDAQQEKRFSYLLSHCKSLRTLIENQPAKQDNVEEREYRSQFDNYVLRGRPIETRTYQGMESIDVGLGGALCPAAYQRELFQDAGTIEPLLDENNVTFIRTKNGNPLTLPTVDMTAMTSVITSQNADLAPSVNPTVGSVVFGAYSYRVNPVAVSNSLNQDAFQPVATLLQKAFSTAIANGAGEHLISGDGSTQPQGVATAATDSGITTPSGVIDETSLLDVYMSLPRIHRVNPKTAWILSDAQYRLVRKITTAGGLPLLQIVDDQERLFGRKVLISNTLTDTFVLADLSTYCVRLATDSVRIRVAREVPGYVEADMSLLSCTVRLDAKLVKPASSVSVAVFGTVGS